MRDINTFLPFWEGFSVVTIRPDGDTLQIDLTPQATRLPSSGGCQKPCSTTHEYCQRAVRDLPIAQLKSTRPTLKSLLSAEVSRRRFHLAACKKRRFHRSMFRQFWMTDFFNRIDPKRTIKSQRFWPKTAG